MACFPDFVHAVRRHVGAQHASELRADPHAVTIAFTEAIEPRFSTIEVRNVDGARVDSGNADGKATTLTVGLTKLPPGSYTVIWHAASVDTHKTEGKYTFSVLP